MKPHSSNNSLALVASDRRIYVHDLENGRRTSVTDGLEGMVFDWPTWSPDGTSLAFVAASARTESESDVRIYVAEPGTAEPREVYREAGTNPFYLSWAPTGEYIAFLSAIAGGLRLRAISAAGGESPDWYVDGQPNFFAWRPDGTELLMHVGGNGAENPGAYIGRVNVRSGDLKRLTMAPGDFRAPSWSPDGSRILVAAQTPQGQSIASMGEDGSGESLAVFAGRAAFQWAPRGAGSRVAALLVPARQQSPGGGLFLLDADGRGDRRLSDEQTLAFWWSPDGTKIASLDADHARRLLVLHVVDVQEGGRRRLASLTPSESVLLLLGFFDQYSLSSSFWSPDSRYFAYAGVTMREQANGHQHPREEHEVFLVAIDGSEPPRSIGPGQLAVFAPSA